MANDINLSNDITAGSQLLLLPRELLQSILLQVFKDSRLTIFLRDGSCRPRDYFGRPIYKFTRTKNSRKGRQFNIYEWSHGYDVLLVCKALYKEGIWIYYKSRPLVIHKGPELSRRPDISGLGSVLKTSTKVIILQWHILQSLPQQSWTMFTNLKTVVIEPQPIFEKFLSRGKTLDLKALIKEDGLWSAITRLKDSFDGSRIDVRVQREVYIRLGRKNKHCHCLACILEGHGHLLKVVYQYSSDSIVDARRLDTCHCACDLREGGFMSIRD